MLNLISTLTQIVYLKLNSHLPVKFLLFASIKSFKNDEKCFSFHLTSCFPSEDIKIFVLSFWSCRKNGLIRNIRLISKSMTSQPG